MDGGDDTASSWESYLTELVRDQTVIVGLEVLAGMTGKVADLARWGARRPMLVAHGTGTGPLPSEDDADIIVLPSVRAATMTEDVRLRMAMPDLPPEVVAAVEDRDPGSEAIWWVSPVNLNEPILGRRVIGGRSRAQADLEDKLLAEQLWDAAGMPRSPAEITDSSYASLVAASERIRDLAAVPDVVWSGDARDGINGGGDFVRWVHDDATARAAADFFEVACDRVRVMPFLDGVPCSIHGMVLGENEVAVFRPVELGILRDSDRGSFAYAGLGTTWDPPERARQDMRDAARAVGRHLSVAVGYRGGFGIDGVMTADGFRPTELNPRFSGAMTRLSRSQPDLLLELLQLNLVAGREPMITADGYEQIAVQAFDDLRFFDAMGISPHVHATSTETLAVTLDDGVLRPAGTDEDPMGEIVLGPSAMGAFVRFAGVGGPDLARTRCGDIGVQVLRLADETWSTGFGPLEVAPEAGGGIVDASGR